MADPDSYQPAFLPRYPPTNALAVQAEEVEYCFEKKNPLHIIRNGGMNVWSQDVDSLQENAVYFGISRKFDCLMSCPMNFKAFPYDLQSLHVFFETNLTTAVVQLVPTLLYKATLDIEFGSLASSADFFILPPIMEFNAFGQNE
jgi:hypothetical protein